jgi:hypothetical protein
MIKTFLLVAVCMAVILTPAASAAADANISVTIAIGGVACGVYFFVSYTVGYISGWKPSQTETALLHRGPKGWRFACPHLKFIADGRSSYAPYVEIINVQF